MNFNKSLKGSGLFCFDSGVVSAAFTLAEVLIVLGIIGIVANLTIPALVNEVNDAHYKAAAKKAYSICSEALTQMKQDEGGTVASYAKSSRSFKPVFMKYFKVLRDCNNTNVCFTNSSPSTRYKILSGAAAPIFSGYTADGQFITADGMFYAFYNTGTFPIMITVDVNGYEKGPNKMGADVYMLQIINDRLLPMGSDGTTFNLAEYCDRTDQGGYSGYACMQKVMLGEKY